MLRRISPGDGALSYGRIHVQPLKSLGPPHAMSSELHEHKREVVTFDVAS